MNKYYVYLIKATNSNGLVKIGRSSRIDDRLRELECPPENVIQLADCMIEIRMKATEKVLHKKYAKWRVPQSEMFNLSDEQIKECSLILQSINAKAVEARQAAHDATVAEYERKAAEQAKRKAAAERDALERDKKLWPVENGRLRKGASQPLRHKFIGTEKTVWRSPPKSMPKGLSKKDEWIFNAFFFLFIVCFGGVFLANLIPTSTINTTPDLQQYDRRQSSGD